MKLEIRCNIPKTAYKELVVLFAQYFTQCDFISLRKMLADKVYILLYNKGQIEGADAVIEYFKDWQSRVGKTF